MDPVSAIASVAQISGQCIKCTVALMKWIGQVRTVDARLQAFYEEVSSLQATNENLTKTLESSTMIEAARATNDSSGHLWSQIETTLSDCDTTLKAINQTLDKINKVSIFGKPYRQLLESIHQGDLSVYFARIQAFNISLQMPIQMVGITLQISQRAFNEASFTNLERQIVGLGRNIRDLGDKIRVSRPTNNVTRKPSLNKSSTLVDISQVDGRVYDNLEKCVDSAKGFLSTASSVASQMSSSSTVLQEGNLQTRRNNIGRGSEYGVMLTQTERLRIDSWVPYVPQNLPTPALSEHEQPKELVRHIEEIHEDDEYSDNDDLILTRAYIDDGQSAMDHENYAAAEEPFREALDLAKSHDFSESLAFGVADITLMLAQCCSKQNKFEEAIDLLRPLTEPAQPTSLRSHREDSQMILAADHMLGLVYLQKEDYPMAEVHALRAFKGRRKILGERHPKSIESVQLVVDMYRVMGKEHKANAHSRFLHPQKIRAESMISSEIPYDEFNRVETMPTEPDLSTMSPDNSHPPIQQSPKPHQAPMNNPVRTPSMDYHSQGSVRKPSKISAHDAGSPSATIHDLEARFLAIQSLATDSKKSKAVDMSLKLLRHYDPEPSRILTIRSDDIKKNISREGAKFGLAATGHGYAPIHFFCELTDYEAVAEVRLLIKHGVNLGATRFRAGYNVDPMTPLQLAIERGYENLAQVIIEAISTATAQGNPTPDIQRMCDGDGLSPLLAACRREQVGVVSSLLRCGIRPPSHFPSTWFGNSLLHEACARCDSHMVRMLLSISDLSRIGLSSIHQQDKFGMTPLMYAIKSSNSPNSTQRKIKVSRREECVELLVQHMAPGPYGLEIKDDQDTDVAGYLTREGDRSLTARLHGLVRRSRSSVPSKEYELAG